MPAHLTESIVIHMSLQAASYKQVVDKTKQSRQQLVRLKEENKQLIIKAASFQADSKSQGA